MPDFSKSKVGDSAWTKAFGNGIITSVYSASVTIKQVLGTYVVSVLHNGKVTEHDQMPSAWHAKPEISDPPPAKRRVKIMAKGTVMIRKSDKEIYCITAAPPFKPYDRSGLEEVPCTITYEVEE